MSIVPRPVVAVAFALLAMASSAAPLTAEQNGSQKVRYVVTVDGTNCWASAVGRGQPALPVRCEAVPVVPPDGATLEPVGDQHLVLKDASGAPVLYYHLVTDRWVEASAVRPGSCSARSLGGAKSRWSRERTNPSASSAVSQSARLPGV